MTLLEAIHVYLSSKTALTALVSTRIYRVIRPQGSELPALAYRKVSGSDELYQSGTSTLGQTRIGFTCWAADPSQAEAIRDVIRDVLQNYSGTITSGAESVVVVRSHLETDAEFYDPPQDASGSGLFSASIDVFFWWRPTAPNP